MVDWIGLDLFFPSYELKRTLPEANLAVLKRLSHQLFQRSRVRPATPVCVEVSDAARFDAVVRAVSYKTPSAMS